MLLPNRLYIILLYSKPQQKIWRTVQNVETYSIIGYCVVFCGILKTRDENAWKYNCEQAVAE